jgi:hypothetical protein
MVAWCRAAGCGIFPIVQSLPQRTAQHDRGKPGKQHQQIWRNIMTARQATRFLSALTLALAAAGTVQAAPASGSADAYGYGFRGAPSAFTDGARSGGRDAFSDGARSGNVDVFTEGARTLV